MASHYHLWAEGKLHVKLALVGVVCVLVVWHLKRPMMHALGGDLPGVAGHRLAGPSLAQG
jgi:hypothetical protein